MRVIFLVFQVLFGSKEGTIMTLRALQLRFCFPPLYGIYDTGDGTIYIFGEHEDEIEQVVSHEVLHWVLQKIAGKKASLGLDNVPPEFLKA
jgi:hypothetical protein